MVGQFVPGVNLALRCIRGLGGGSCASRLRCWSRACSRATAHAKARASVGWGIGGDPGQFDCVDTTANTTSLLVVLARLGLLRHHEVSTPISRLLAGGPHFTATMRDKRSGQHWTVDPWTHDNGVLPDVWTVERWSAGK